MTKPSPAQRAVYIWCSSYGAWSVFDMVMRVRRRDGACLVRNALRPSDPPVVVGPTWEAVLSELIATQRISPSVMAELRDEGLLPKEDESP